uniref:Putative secreted protein n=1 Tax=Ixodes ricinus TaxID=34613 RepID=A0A6B0UKG0_IXORI
MLCNLEHLWEMPKKAIFLWMWCCLLDFSLASVVELPELCAEKLRERGRRQHGDVGVQSSDWSDLWVDLKLTAFVCSAHAEQRCLAFGLCIRMRSTSAVETKPASVSAALVEHI